MTLVLVILAGVVVGAGAGRLMVSAARHYGSAPDMAISDYEIARRAVVRHVHAHGTINLVQVERMLDSSGTSALQCLDLMVRDGFLKAQGHRDRGVFYTLV